MTIQLPQTVPAIVAVNAHTNIDVDSLDSSLHKSLLALGVQPVDQTSNQVLIVQAILDPVNFPLLQKIVSEDAQKGWSSIMDRMSVNLCKQNEDLISGRFLLQTSPQHAYDSEKIIAHARSYATEFEKVGLNRDRFCIKVPATGAGVTAAKVLEAEGIRTLGTSLFSVPQAIACSQAGCLSISPYFNEIPAHNPSSGLWPDVADVSLEHPMSPRMVQIYNTYDLLAKKTGKQQPMIKAASNISGKEVVAIARDMGAQHITILAPVIKQLLEQQVPIEETRVTHPKPQQAFVNDKVLTAQMLELLKADSLSVGGKAFVVDHDVDYLAHNGAALDEVIKQDPETAKRLKDSLDLFIGAEAVAKEAIEKVIKGESIEGLVFGGL
ncbi:unnamed protein product [Sympodiomycopsis kandeliae]